MYFFFSGNSGIRFINNFHNWFAWEFPSTIFCTCAKNKTRWNKEKNKTATKNTSLINHKIFGTGNSHLTSLTIVKTIVARMSENPNSSLCSIFEGLGSTEAKNWRDNISPSKELTAFPAEKMQQAGNRRFPADGLVHVWFKTMLGPLGDSKRLLWSHPWLMSPL